MSRWKQVPPQPGRTFVVTGASSGVGLATADALARAGAHVVMAVRNRAKGEEAAATIHPANGGSVEVGIVDVADLDSVRSFAGTVGEIDVLINNAGVLAVPFALTPEGVETHFATNHLGHFALTNLLLPRIRDRVVVVASASHKHGDLQLDDLDWSRRGYKAYAAYAASKLANLQFLTELNRPLLDNPELQVQILANVPLGRWGKPEEIGPLAVYLCSEEAGFVTGADVLIDGGWTAR